MVSGVHLSSVVPSHINFGSKTAQLVCLFAALFFLTASIYFHKYKLVQFFLIDASILMIGLCLIEFSRYKKQDQSQTRKEIDIPAPLNLPPTPDTEIITVKDGNSNGHSNGKKNKTSLTPTPYSNSIRALIKVRMAKNFGFGTL